MSKVFRRMTGSNGETAEPVPPSRPVSPEVEKAMLKRIREGAMALGWKFPFFLPAIARVGYRVDYRISTACVDLRGNLRANPTFIGTLSDLQLQFIIAHELMHLLMLHHDRRGSRKPVKWNRATDRIINLTLKRIAEAAGAGSIEAPPHLLYARDDQADQTAEQLYADEEDWPEDDAYDPFQVPVGQGCGPMPAEGDGDDGEGLAPAPDDTLRRQWREVAAQAQMSGRAAGDVAGNMLADLLDIPPPKVRWSEVLRGALYRALAEAGHDDVSWQRRSRRSTPSILLPGGVTYKCRAAVVVDTSGSMSDDALKQAVAEIERIVNHTRVTTFLVVHDHCVQEACWIKPGSRAAVHTQLKKRMKGRGGTSFNEAYKRVEQEGRFNMLIHLTDGEVDAWPAKPNGTEKLVVALLGSACKAEVPFNVRVIEVEL